MAARTVEIDESTLLAQRQLTGLYEQMLANPKSRELLTQAAKIINPNVATPELDAKAEIRAELQAERQARLDLETRLNKDAEDRAAADRLRDFSDGWNKKRSGLRTAGYTEAGIAEIEKLAEERGIIDLEAAAALFDRLHPPAAVASPTGYGGLDQFQSSSQDDEDFKALLESEGENPTAERNMINKALTDFRTGRA